MRPIFDIKKFYANIISFDEDEDYVKLKFMSFTVHKDAVKNILKKMKT